MRSDLPMTSTTDRDATALSAGLTRWLARDGTRRHVSLTGFHRPSAGYSNDTVVVDATWSEDGTEHHRSLVVRMPPAGDGTFPHHDLVAEGQAATAAAAVGVPVADPVVEGDTAWIGTPFMVMSRIDGHIIGPLAHRDRWLTGRDPADQRQVYDTFLTTLATIHRADPAAAPGVPRRDNGAELAFWAEYLRWSSDGSPVPALVDALSWCRSHRPATEADPVLLWGDARFENQVIGDDLRVRAVLDWDMTSVGAPEHDLAWFTSLDLTMHHLFGERLAAFPDRAATIARFEQASGRAVRDLGWYETLALVRAAAVMTRIGYLRRRAGEPLMMPIESNPILDLVGSRLR